MSRRLLILAACALTLPLGGCRQQYASTRSEAKDARRDQRRAINQSQASRVGQASMAGSRPTNDSTPFTTMRGYVVRATDEYSFRPCGVDGVYFVRGIYDAQAKLTQQYRFRARNMMSPVYFVVRSRLLADTVVAGENTFEGVAEIMQILDASRTEEPRCRAPTRAMLLSSR